MKKLLIVMGASFALMPTFVSADALKNSLDTMLKQQESTPKVDLDNLNLNAKSESLLSNLKKRSAKTIVATVDGYPIRKSEADSYLKRRTNGQVKNFDILPKQQRLRLIEEMASSILVNTAANRELSNKEKEEVYKALWMRKQMSKTDVTNEEIQARYETIKKDALQKNAHAQIPPYISIGEKLRQQIIQEKIMKSVMKDVKIEVNFD